LGDATTVTDSMGDALRPRGLERVEEWRYQYQYHQQSLASFQIRYKETPLFICWRVPKANNSGEYVSEHNHVRQGDIVLKYALTCAVRGAVLANKNSSIKLFYRKISKKGVSPLKAQIAAARKVACIVWKVLSSKQPYAEQDDHMTKRKMNLMSSKAMRIMPTSVMPSKVSELVRNLANDIDVLGKYHEDSDYSIGKDLSNKSRLKEDILR
jgi:hypothetical protein